MERRNFAVAELRINDGDSKPAVISGYAAVFGSPSEDLGGFIEMIEPGAFAENLNGDIRALWNHESKYVLGRTTNDTLKLTEDEHGLKFEILPPGTSYAQDLLTLIKRGDISQMSFGFEVVDDAWHTEDGVNYRVLKKVKLFEVSPVTFPAYPETSAEARAMAKQLAVADRRATAADAVDDSSVGRPDIKRKKLDLIEMEI